MLSLTLRNLERDGLVTRTVTPCIPPRVDYELTELGHSLAEPIQALGGWAFKHIAHIDAAQALYNAQVASGLVGAQPAEQGQRLAAILWRMAETPEVPACP
jgi:DNA-binding PadR family transcriptional regulator